MERLAGAVAEQPGAAPGAAGRRLPPALLLLLLAAIALRFSTLSLQSLWYDEAFTAVHVFNGSFGHLLAQIPHTENTPPLWYILQWLWIQIAGSGAFALRLISALAGVGLVGVMWLIGSELGGRRVAIAAAALSAFSPLFLWYSQEARAYSLYAFLLSVSFLCFLRAERKPAAGTLAAFAISSVLALCTHYFAAFLVVPMALWLMRSRERMRRNWPALIAIGAAGAALLPLAIAQGGRGAEWIGKLSLLSRVEAIPQYYLTGYSGAPLGRGVELLVALPLLLGSAYALWQLVDPRRSEQRTTKAALLCLGICACGLLAPIGLVAFGANFFDPRNVIGAMIPATALLAVLLGSPAAGRVGAAFAALGALALLAVCIDVDRSPRLQRGDWSGVARALRRPPARDGTAGPATGLAQRLLVTVHLGSAPLEYYLPHEHAVGAGLAANIREIDEVGYAPLAANAAQPPASGFVLAQRSSIHGLDLFRFVSARPVQVSIGDLLAHPITPEAGKPAVLAGS